MVRIMEYQKYNISEIYTPLHVSIETDQNNYSEINMSGASEEIEEGYITPPCGIFFFVMYGPLYGLVCLLGLIGNSLSFAVLHKYSRNNVATYLLKALAVSDNLFLAFASVINMYPAMCMFFGLIDQLEPVYPYIKQYLWPFIHMVQMGTVYMMVLVAANRYIAVCKPLHAPRLCTKRNVQIQILIMTICIVIYNIPRFFEYQFVERNFTSTANLTIFPEADNNVGLIRYHLYNILYENVAYCLFVFLVPLLVLIVFNLHLVRDLKKAQKSRKALTSRSTMEENNITLVMIIIIIVFIICQTPASVNQILYYIIGQSQQNGCTSYIQFFHVCNLLITMNSSLNFVIYCLFRRQFQQELIALLCRHHKIVRNGSRRTVVLRSLHERSNSIRGGSFRSSSIVRHHQLETVPLHETSDYSDCIRVNSVKSRDTALTIVNNCNGNHHHV